MPWAFAIFMQWDWIINPIVALFPIGQADMPHNETSPGHRPPWLTPLSSNKRKQSAFSVKRTECRTDSMESD